VKWQWHRRKKNESSSENNNSSIKGVKRRREIMAKNKYRAEKRKMWRNGVKEKRNGMKMA